MAKDKGAKKSSDKTPASKTLKEKRAAKKSKGEVEELAQRRLARP